MSSTGGSIWLSRGPSTSLNLLEKSPYDYRSATVVLCTCPEVEAGKRVSVPGEAGSSLVAGSVCSPQELYNRVQLGPFGNHMHQYVVFP